MHVLKVNKDLRCYFLPLPVGTCSKGEIVFG